MSSESGKISQLLESDRVNLSLLYVFIYASWAAWWSLFNVFLKEAGLTGLQIGIVSSIAPVMMFIVQPFWGGVADRWGRKRLLLFSLFLSAVTILGYPFLKDFWAFLLWSVLFSVLLNPIYPIADSLALDYIEEKKSTSYGMLRIWGAIGWLSGAPLAGQMSGWRGLGMIFPVGAVLLLGAFFIARRIKTRISKQGSLDVNFNNAGTVLRERQLLVFLIFVLLISTGLNVILTFYSVYMTEIGASSQLIGWAFSIQGLSELPIYLISGLLILRLGILRTVMMSFIFVTVRAFLYSIISEPALAMAVELTHGFSIALLIVTSVEYINKLVPPKWRATGQSLFWAAIYGGGTVIGNISAGALYDYMTMQNVFRIFSVFLLIILILALFILRDRNLPSASDNR